MARNQGSMTDREIAELRDKLNAQREAVRAALVESLGGDPEDYRADRPVADGGE